MTPEQITEAVLADAVFYKNGGGVTLSVRVSGWNARFVTLDDAWQRMVLERAGYFAKE